MTVKAFGIVVCVVLSAALSVREPFRAVVNQPQFSICPSRATNQDTPCPIFQVECSDTEPAGKAIVFRVPGLYGPRPLGKVSYRWKVSAGRIIKGQGTNTIVVDTRDVNAESITGGVKVGGFPQDCSLVAKCSVQLLRNKEE